MTNPRGGRPRTFPPGAVELALVERNRTGRTWAEIARELGVHPNTLRTRAAEWVRLQEAGNGARKTPARALDAEAPTESSSPPSPKVAPGVAFPDCMLCAPCRCDDECGCAPGPCPMCGHSTPSRPAEAEIVFETTPASSSPSKGGRS